MPCSRRRNTTWFLTFQRDYFYWAFSQKNGVLISTMWHLNTKLKMNAPVILSEQWGVSYSFCHALCLFLSFWKREICRLSELRWRLFALAEISSPTFCPTSSVNWYQVSGCHEELVIGQGPPPLPNLGIVVALFSAYPYHLQNTSKGRD